MTYLEVDALTLTDSWKKLRPRWGHSLHTICSRTGSFPPRLAHYFIERYSEVGETVLDVYSGKGTAPLEACLLGRKGIGNDASPDAFVLTYAKTNPPSKSCFAQYLGEIRDRLKKADISEVPDNVSLYFESKTLEQILSVQEIIRSDLDSFESQIEKRNNAMFLQALMLGILHGSTEFSLSLPLPHSFAMSPSYVRKKVADNPKKYKPRRRDVVKCLKTKADLVFKDATPTSFRKGNAFMLDAADFCTDKSVDLILSSPPYFDVHTYAWDNWLRLWFLGYDHKEVAQRLVETSCEEHYLNHIEKALKRMYAVLKEDSRCFLVVGDVKGHRPTAYLIADLVNGSSNIGFKVNQIVNDTIDRRRRYPYGNNHHTGILMERILELHKGNPPNPRNRIIWPIK